MAEEKKDIEQQLDKIDNQMRYMRQVIREGRYPEEMKESARKSLISLSLEIDRLLDRLNALPKEP